MNVTDFSDEQLAGQRLMAGFDGTQLNENLRFLIKNLKIGGIILFRRNLISPDQIRELCLVAQGYAVSCGQPPLLIAIDQEGGQVARLEEPFTTFPGNPSMKSKEDAANFARITAAELKNLGINMNMAPVMDVPPKNFKSVIGKRAFGNNPEWVAEMGSTVITHLQKNMIMAVAKHFPGIGRTSLDSHLDAPFLDTQLSEMESTDLLPFKAAINCKAAGIMLSHIRYTLIDPDRPASLSRMIAKDLLRDQMGYNGIILTDDLDMGAIKKYFTIQESIRNIINAEIDIALICHQGPDISTAFEEIRELIHSSSSIKTQCIESCRRMAKLKNAFNLL
jgi:beta-N-acetylhexosaminidase